MLLQAVEAPLLKMAAVAGLAVAATFGAATLASGHRCDGGAVYRLELHAPQEPNAIYLTAWRQGDVFVRFAGSNTLTFETRARVWDGCEWLATETLVPEGSGRYFYSYDEQVVSCEPGATPTRKTPRTGYVLAVRAD